MCGICGEIQFGSRTASLDRVQRMLPCLERRGPDAAGVYHQGRMAFGHRRLKIIDLSDHSQQPMVDSQLGLTIVYNGAIYNYKELREELKGYGYTFFSSGDTEVLLKAYHRWGADMVEKLQGMFAFAIWERDVGRAFVARDRLGIKPFYYAEVDGAFRFASNPQALLATGGIDTEIDPVALHHYMTFHAVVPPPHTILRGVRKLPPATWMRIEPDGTKQTRTYWDTTFDPDPADADLSEEDWYDRVLDVMRRSVKRRCVADVPVGVLLSGGIDSSLVVGLLAEAGQTGLHTFSIGFETVNDEVGDEFKYSDIIVDHFGTNHHKLFIDSSRALTAMPDCVDAMSEPMVSHDVIGFYLLSEKVSQHIRVVQSGQGADEIFGGYHWYPPMMNSVDPLNDYAKGFFDRDHAEFAEAVMPDWVSEDYSRNFVAEHFNRPGATAAVDKALRIDGTIMLVDDPVKRVDNTTMAWGLEARVPFLDHEVVEMGARTPAALKVKNGGKYVLKEAARRIIPAGVIDRPKGYFPVPALKYLRGPFLEMVKDVLNAPEAQQRGLFNRAYVDKLLADPENHITPLRGSKLWQVALLEFWLQRRGV